MSFKPSTAKIDISLDMTEYLKPDDIELTRDSGVIKTTKNPTAAEYVKWAEDAAEDLKKADDDTDGDFSSPTKGMSKIIKQIDYWYGKGEKWWIERCTFPVLQEVLEFLNDEVTRVRKK